MKLIIDFDVPESVENVFGNGASNLIHDLLLHNKYTDIRLNQLINNLADDIDYDLKYKSFEVTN